MGEETCISGRCVGAAGEVSGDGGIRDESVEPDQKPTDTCQPTTCAKEGKNCGQFPDGCGATLECGQCKSGETCGAGGKANICGVGKCTPKTCQSEQATCGQLANGCGKVLDCGQCAAGKSCGKNQCVCQPKTCAQQGAQCGQLPDGCGSTLECGQCKSGETCGAGGKANTCGSASCTPKTCKELGAQCGKASDGCGKVLDCGSCQSNQTCDNSQQVGRCVCQPKTCQDLKLTCGKAQDGCGKTIDCGPCPVCEPSCPKGYQCTQGTCDKGPSQAIELDVKTVQIGGTVTLNGKAPVRDTRCDANDTYTVYTIRFVETTYGYNFTYDRSCKDIVSNGFTFSGAIFPGTYKVTVQGRSSAVNLPRVAQIMDSAFTIKTSRNGIVFDVKTFDIGGKVTLNGKAPVRDTRCDANDTYTVYTVRFVETTHGYNFAYDRSCKDIVSNGFTFSGAIFPGTYKVTVQGRSSAVNLPRVAQVIIEKSSLTANRNNYVLDVKTFDIGGKVTLNGKAPVRDTRCDANDTYTVYTVRFVETTHGYNFTYDRSCKDIVSNGFTFSGAIFPGVYKVTVQGRSSAVNLPRVAQVIIEKSSITANRNNYALDVKTFDVSGKVTLNGKAPVRDTRCDVNDTYTVYTVRFVETTYGYNFTYDRSCKDIVSNGFTFSGAIFPGTYKVTVQGRSSAVNLPRVAQIIIPSSRVATNRSNYALDVKTFDIGGKVTLNGKAPVRDTRCDVNDTYTVYTVRFVETTHGYNFTYDRSCKDIVSNGFTFSGAIFPGTYKVTVQGRSSAVNLPRVAQIILEKSSITANRNNYALDVKTVQISGTVTLNGKAPVRDTRCDANDTYTVYTVRFVETTHGYNFTYDRSCKDIVSNGFTFSGAIFPGVYKVTVQGRSSAVNLPRVAQIMASRLRIP